MSGRKRLCNVLIVHQSADLYGSDRVLRSLVLRLQQGPYHPVVLLPERGPLYQSLIADGVEAHVVPLAKVTRSTLSINGLLSIPFILAVSLLRIRKLMAGRNVRAVYSNTLAVLSGAVYATCCRLPHLWHVHELIASPSAARKTFPLLLRLFADRVVCNSHQTKNWVVGEQSALAGRTVTVLNGVERSSAIDPDSAQEFRRRAGADQKDLLLVTLVGRINRMKGQSVLVEAAELLQSREYRHLRYAIVGSPPCGQEHFLAALELRLARSPARDAIALLGYAENVWPIWDATDIAVVPSIEPESFGLVAAEAMAAGKPVVASSLGGLLDIIETGVSGLLVMPGDAQALADAIAALADDEALRRHLGATGMRRQSEVFALARQLDQLERQIDGMVTR